jgi:hypothetical protein
VSCLCLVSEEPCLQGLGKKEIWIGLSDETDMNGDPHIEISWGCIGQNRVSVPFDALIRDTLEAYEQGGPNSGGEYDYKVINVLTRMIDLLKLRRRHVKNRNGL